MPYRKRDLDQAVPQTKTGLVADMVRQFADPYAFVRELVQNGIDAGASALHVRAEARHDGGATLSVSDDGEGMTREIIEGPLLTLFNSAKDKAEGKIGKYGIGFVSVFAVAPKQVIVDTWRRDVSWRLTLRPDHSYELAIGPDRPDSGTIVQVVLPPGDDHPNEHAARMYTALVKWCRHAKLPIHWTQQSHGQPVQKQRVDRALEVASVLSVSASMDGAEIVLGPSGGDQRGETAPHDDERAESFIGFYNHGLTLYEATTPPDERLVGLRVKILSDALQHTLSRDNVRHDRAYDRAVANAVTLSRGTLRDRLREQLTAAARAVAADGDSGRYESLLHVALSQPINFDIGDVVVPLTDDFDGDSVRLAKRCSWRDGTFAWSNGSSRATALLAAEGKPVIAARWTRLQNLFMLLFGARLTEVASLVSVAAVADPDETEAALCDATRAALCAAGVDVATVELGHVDGVAVNAAVRAETGQDLLLDRRVWPDWYSRFLRRAQLRLIAEHEAVSRAVGMARHNPTIAGALLARYLIVGARGELDAGANAKLLRLSLEGEA